MPEVITDEAHRMRYFFADELRAFLDATDLSLQNVTAFPDTNTPLSAASWNVLVTASG
jgi:hypothetical protein